MKYTKELKKRDLRYSAPSHPHPEQKYSGSECLQVADFFFLSFTPSGLCRSPCASLNSLRQRSYSMRCFKTASKMRHRKVCGVRYIFCINKIRKIQLLRPMHALFQTEVMDVHVGENVPRIRMVRKF